MKTYTAKTPATPGTTEMSDIPIPQKGSPISLNWGKAVTESCNAARAIGTGGLVRSGPFGLGEAPLPANLRDRRPSVAIKPHPFKVRVANFDKEAATWQLQIYLPACEDILVYQNSHVDPCYSDDLEYPEGAEGYWYNVLCDSPDGTLYLKIVKDDEGYNKVSYSIDYGASGDGVAAIAYISSVYDDDGALQSVSVEQYVHSSLHLGGEAKWKDPDPGYFNTEE